MIKLLANYIDITNFRSILCLNGDLPDSSLLTGNLPIIAADGAANKLIAMGIKPTMIVGDLDSVHPDIVREHATHHLSEQDTSDYQKALAYMQEHALLPAIVTGINGGALDHILNNVNIFLQTKSIFFAPPTMGFCVHENETKSLSLPPSTKISIIGFPDARISTQGLKWELENQHLTFPGHNSCFNRTTEVSTSIRVQQGSALVIIHLEEVVDGGL